MARESSKVDDKGTPQQEGQMVFEWINSTVLEAKVPVLVFRITPAIPAQRRIINQFSKVISCLIVKSTLSSFPRAMLVS
ncbi:hypothetical protein CEP54_008109 [Fusarium duplospermum]|uniref:Uncharacterized protein n=1 Tax=Fusarium duplospermum TaxID=1325734 RepID=A0A428PXR5_9HYPO|nr:hypothetical protein CEP54_008109 [Fusarium duplospermum]